VTDLRQALRSLRKQPGFAAVAILTLAFGIGVNVSLFGMFSAFFLRPLGVKDAGRLVFILQRSDIINVPYGYSYPDFLDFRSEASTFSDLVAFTPQPAHVSARCHTPDRTWIEIVSTLIVRSATEPAALGDSLRRLLNRMDPDLPVYNVRTMKSHIEGSVFALLPMRLGMAMAGVQGAIAVLLAIMGLYAVVSYAVARRTREIGIRMALGAERADVVRLVGREGMQLSMIGICVGLVLALGLGAVLSAVLYEVRSVDVPVLSGVTVLLLAVSGLTWYVPARKATRVDPLVALRCE
jgi:FtsX-like permease family